MRAHSEWNVDTHTPEFSPSKDSNLSFISFVALLVKVMARMECGSTFFSSIK